MTPATQALREFADKHGLTSRMIAQHLRVSDRLARYWLSDQSEMDIPYASAIALRCLLEHEND